MTAEASCSVRREAMVEEMASEARPGDSDGEVSILHLPASYTGFLSGVCRCNPTKLFKEVL